MAALSDFFDGMHGVVFPFCGTTAPSGFLMCDGSAVSRTTYQTLFNVIGTTYGAGNGSTTFNLPDLRGRVIAGRDNMGGVAAGRLTATGTGSPGIDGTVLGATGGVDRHTLATTQIPSHTHSGTTGSENTTHTHGLDQIWDVVSGTSSMTGSGSSGYGPKQTGGQSTNHQHTFTTDSGTGGGQSHPNVQPTIVLHYIIKT